MSIKRVHWTVDETKQVLNKAWLVFQQKKLVLPFGRGVLKAVVKEAQEAVLPPERWRNVNLIHHFQFVELDIMDRLTAPVEPVEEVPPAVEIPVQDVIGEVLSKQEELEDLVAENIAQLFLQSDAGKRLISKVSEKIRQKVMDSVKPVESSPTVTPSRIEDVSVAAAVKPAQMMEVSVTPKKLPRIGVAGGDSRLFRMLQDEFDGVLDLRCFNSEQLKRAGAVASRFSNCEKVLICTGYLGHSSYHNVKNSVEKWEHVKERTPETVINKLYGMCNLTREAGAA